MKKLILATAVGMLVAVSAWAQGKIDFNTLVASLPFVTETDGTTRLAGSAYLANLYYGTPGTDPAGWTSAGVAAAFNSGGQAGLITGPEVTLTGFNWGSTVGVQVRAWRASDGGTWEAASAVAGAHASYPIATIPTVNVVLPSKALPTDPDPLSPRLTGLTGHRLSIVPEPSTILLGLAGLGGLFLLRRKVS